MHIGQAHIASGVAEGEPFVIDAHEMENGGPEVEDARFPIDDMITELIRLAVDRAALHSAAGEPDTEAEGIVVTAVTALGKGCAAELSGPDNESLIEESALFQIPEQPGDGLIDLLGHVPVSFFETAVLVPGVGSLASAGSLGKAGEFDEADAALNETAGEKSLMSIGARHGVFGLEAVEPLRRVALTAEIAEFGHGGLHTVGGLVVADRGLDRSGLPGRIGEFTVDRADEIEPASLHRVAFQWANVRNRIRRINPDDGGLMLGGEKAAAPLPNSAVGRVSLAAFQDDVAGQVAVLGAESVAGPRPDTGVSDERKAGVEKEISLGVLVDRTRHRPHHREVIGTVGPQMRKEIGDGNPASAARSKIERTAVDVSVVVELGALDLHRHGFAVKITQQWLGIKAVEVRDAARHVAKDDPLRARPEVRARDAFRGAGKQT